MAGTGESLSCRLVLSSPVRSHVDVEFSVDDTVDSLRMRASEWVRDTHPSVHFPPPLQPRLFCAGTELGDASTPLSRLGIGTGTQIFVVVPHVRPSIRPLSLAPTTCLETGGAHVRIFGEGFTPSCVCKFGNALTLTRFVSSTELMATAPAHSPGTVSVEVSPDGHAFSVGGPSFTYIALRDAQGTALGIPAECGTRTTLVEMERAAALNFRHDRGNL